MKELIQVVENYLKTDKINYAILVKGEWGSGKTYFFKTELVPVINKLKYIPLYISLYGIASTDEIARRIFYELYPSSGTKTAHKLSEIGKAVLSGVSAHGYSLKIDWDKLSSKTWLNIKSSTHVLCFDDLERANLNVEEILGYINNFVEHDNVKTILIAHEDEIIERQQKANYEIKAQAAVDIFKKFNPEKGELSKDEISKKIKELFGDEISYPKIKEKLIGFTVDYKPEISSIFKNLAEVYTEDFKKFLLGESDLVLDIFRRSGSNNIRAFKRSLDYFATVFYSIKKSSDISLSADFILNLFFFAVAVSIEITLGRAIINDLNKISSSEAAVNWLFLLEEKDRKKEYVNEFLERYYDGFTNKFYFSRSVYRFILNGFFDNKAFFKEASVDEPKMEDPRTKVTRLFLDSTYYKLSNDDFMRNKRLILTYLGKGDIAFYLYPRLFSILCYLSEKKIIKENADILRRIFKKGIELAYKKMDLEEFRKTDIQVSDFQGTIDEIQIISNGYIEALKERDLKNRINTLFEYIPGKISTFSYELHSENNDFWRISIFKGYDLQKLLRKILKLSNPEIIGFSTTLHKRYRPDLHIGLVDDLACLNHLKNLLNSKLDSKKVRTLRIHLLEVLINNISEICTRLESVKKIDNEKERIAGDGQ